MEGRPATSSALSPASLGTAIHLTLQRLVEEWSPFSPQIDLRSRVAEIWDDVLVGTFGSLVRPQSIPAYHLKLARLGNAAAHLQRMLAGLDRVVTELDLSTEDGVLRGRADLVGYRGSEAWILDYKSGIERDPVSCAFR
jgi:ATP-dependent exoDNAse (exonuclease V) beta subunit